MGGRLARPTVKYHYFYRFFTYSVKRRLGRRSHDSGIKPAELGRSRASVGVSRVIRSEDSVRRGV